MTYLYEDNSSTPFAGAPLEFPERRNLSLRKFHALGAFKVMDLRDPGILIKEACELADTNDKQDYKDALRFYQENPYRWDLGDFETAYCPDCKQETKVAYHQLSDGDYSVECPECSFPFKG